MGNRCPKCQFDNLPDTLYCGKCATPLPSPKEIPVPHTKTLETPKEELTTGSTFAGRYQIIEELGKGGMGKVYKAHDTEIKEKVALKLLKSEIAADEKTIERFKNEIRLARKIVHKNVGRMYDLGKAEGSYFITMEYVAGQDLRGLIRQTGQLTVGKAISIASQVCEGLTEAHRLGVVHRDLKPSNIMIDKEGNARIMDFGIARSLKAKGITGAGVIIGTPEYMSPEQVDGKEVDQRADIYSLGVILYEMVTGRVPFEGDTSLSIAYKHKHEIPTDPRKLNAQIPDDLSSVILKCLEKGKENRYQSAGELRSELTRIEKGIPTTERVAPKRKPLTSKEITVQFSLKKLFIPALIFIAVVIIGLILWQVLPKKKAVPLAPSDKPSLAVMYFENNTGDTSFNHYRKAISGLLITDLSQSKYIQVLSGARLFNILNKLDKLETKTYSSEVLREVAARGGVGYVIVGSYSKAGDVFRLNYSLLDADTSAIIGSEVVEGRGEENIFAMVDELTRKIKANFELSEEEIASDFDMDIGEITTSSPEAYKYYSEGAKYDHLGQYKKGIELMERAIEIDPDFAMAYRSIGVTYSDMGYYSKQKEYLQKALELSNRVSIRERYQIQGDYYWMSEKTYDKAIEAYSKLLELYPEDTNANINLGSIYRGVEEWDKARERFEVLRQAKDESIFPYISLAIISMAKELYDEAGEILEYYLKNISDNTALHYGLAGNYVYQGKLNLALSEVDKAFILEPDDYYPFMIRGDIYQYRGDLIEAEKEYQKLLKAEEPRANYQGYRRLATLYLLQGKLEKAKDQIKQAISWAEKFGEMASKAWCYGYLGYLHLAAGSYEKALKECGESWNIAVASDLTDYQRLNFYMKGLTYVEMKSLDKAKEAAEEFKKRVEKGMNKKEIRYYFDLMGKLELEKGNFSKAIEYINKALPLEPFGPFNKPVLFLETLALAYYKSGEIEKAKEQYEKITSLTTGRLWNSDTYAKSFYMLGKIYEQQGDNAKAIEHYQKFLSLWKDADPGIAEVKDAKKRLGDGGMGRQGDE